MQEVILALLELFRRRAPDAETNALVIAVASDRNNWAGAHALFSRIRRRCLDLKDERGGHARMSQ